MELKIQLTFIIKTFDMWQSLLRERRNPYSSYRTSLTRFLHKNGSCIGRVMSIDKRVLYMSMLSNSVSVAITNYNYQHFQFVLFIFTSMLYPKSNSIDSTIGDLMH